MNDKYYIKCVKKDGETYYAYNGAEFDKERAEATQRDCSKYWPDILFTVVDHKE